jgi:hypothetical protein
MKSYKISDEAYLAALQLRGGLQTTIDDVGALVRQLSTSEIMRVEVEERLKAHFDVLVTFREAPAEMAVELDRVRQHLEAHFPILEFRVSPKEAKR